MTQHDHRVGLDGLPPLAAPDASADERHAAVVARMVARYGAPSLEDCRWVYGSAGLEWPGDEEVRGLHPVAADPAAWSAARSSTRPLWPLWSAVDSSW